VMNNSYVHRGCFVGNAIAFEALATFFTADVGH